MQASWKRHRYIVLLAASALAIAGLSLHGAVSWYGRPFPGILVDPDGVVSSFGLPSWDGVRQGLRFPDRVIAVEGAPLGDSGRRQATWDAALTRAVREGKPTVGVRVASEEGVREVSLPLVPFDALAWWLLAGAPFLLACLFSLGALIALAASPNGRLARTFAKTTLLGALFFFSVFDYHTTRAMVPLFLVSFALVPAGIVGLTLRLPDDARLAVRFPVLFRVLDGLGAALAVSLLWTRAAGISTSGLRQVCAVQFGASLGFLALSLIVRFLRARGDTRATLRALLLAMAPTCLIVSAAFLLSSIGLLGSTGAFCALPAFALTPLATLVAFIRHDLWGSRALLSRVVARAVIALTICVLAVALGTACAAVLGVPFKGALLAAAASGVAASALVTTALWAGDKRLFSSRAVYKPTIEQLSEDLTLINVPEEVSSAVERTVRRWLPCERVEFFPTPGAGSGPRAEAIVDEVSADRVLSQPERPEPAEAPRRDAPDVSRASASGEHLIPLPAELRSMGAANEPTSAPADELSSGIKAAPAGRAPRSIARPALASSNRASWDELADELSLPVLFRGRSMATLRVGRKRGGALFTSEDLDLLRTIANQAALALAHAHSYAELETRRREQAAAWQGEREALVETVAAEIAHEVRYPINFFRSIFQRGSAGQQLDAEEVDIGCEEVDRLERLVSGLRRVAVRKLERRRVPVDQLIAKAEMLLRDRLRGRRLELSMVGSPAVRCDWDQATQILVNLISNALDAAGERGTVGVAWAVTAEGGSLTVWDSGPGFAGDPSRLFAPWYTTKPRGTGLGLAITHRIVRSHGWNIEPSRSDGRTRFVIAIPAADVLSRDGRALSSGSMDVA